VAEYTHSDSEHEEWRQILTGENPYLQKFQKYMGKLPSAPRCKLCMAPFAGPFVPLLRIAGFARWQLNSQMCVCCIRKIDKQSGGAEIPVSVLYADVRGSTTIAEEIGATEFTASLNSFYTTTARLVDSEQGVIDHIAGDGMLALWIPAFAGGDHPRRALEAGRSLTAMLLERELPVGVAVHTGDAYVGVIGELGSRDFTVLGDVPNTVARMAGVATAGELLISEPVATAADVDTAGLERREVSLRGKSAPIGVWVEVPAPVPT
jgi:adenylate cyclase